MHAVVGVMIGIAANTWTGRIVAPFIWGVVWCVRLRILSSGQIVRAGRNPWAFYGAEYLKAFLASLVLSLAVGSLKALFRFAVLK